MGTPESLAGIEFDWFAVDAAGRVALLTTGGAGPVPPAVAAHAADVGIAASRLAGLPVVGDAVLARTDDADFSDWEAASNRGLFTYDWDTTAGHYARVSTPSFAVGVDRVPAQLRYAAGLAALALSFAEEDDLPGSALG